MAAVLVAFALGVICGVLFRAFVRITLFVGFLLLLCAAGTALWGMVR